MIGRERYLSEMALMAALRFRTIQEVFARLEASKSDLQVPEHAILSEGIRREKEANEWEGKTETEL